VLRNVVSTGNDGGGGASASKLGAITAAVGTEEDVEVVIADTDLSGLGATATRTLEVFEVSGSTVAELVAPVENAAECCCCIGSGGKTTSGEVVAEAIAAAVSTAALMGHDVTDDVEPAMGMVLGLIVMRSPPVTDLVPVESIASNAIGRKRKQRLLLARSIAGEMIGAQPRKTCCPRETQLLSTQTGVRWPPFWSWMMLLMRRRGRYERLARQGASDHHSTNSSQWS
jgi:hypothetical protein